MTYKIQTEQQRISLELHPGEALSYNLPLTETELLIAMNKPCLLAKPKNKDHVSCLHLAASPAA